MSSHDPSNGDLQLYSGKSFVVRLESDNSDDDQPVTSPLLVLNVMNFNVA